MKNSNGKKFPPFALLIILGLVLILFRDALPDIVLRIFAAGLIVIGVFGFIQLIRDKEEKKGRVSKGLVLLIYVVLGLLIMIFPGFFASFIKFVLGGVMILFGLKDLIPAIREKQGFVKIILSAVALFIGAYLIFFPPESIMLVAGIALIYCGITSFLSDSKK